MRAQTALSPLKGKKPAKGINFPRFRCLPSASLTPCACFPWRSGDKSSLLSPDSLARSAGCPVPCPLQLAALGRVWGVCLPTGTRCLERPTELLPKRNFCSALLCPQNKTSPHRTAAVACSWGRQRGSGLKSPLVSHPRVLALTLQHRRGLLGPPHPSTQLSVRLGFSSSC